MSVLVWLAAAWLVVASVTAVVVGTAIRLADHRDAARRRGPAATTPTGRTVVHIPAPRTAETHTRVTDGR
jgi:hypothetical protein